MKYLKAGLTVIAAMAIVACGGGSSGSFDAGRDARLTVSPQQESVEANPSDLAPNPDASFTVQIDVRLVLANGNMAADGTAITLSSSSAARGVLSTLAAPADTGASVTTTTTGGVARFWFTSGRDTGSVTLTASTQNPSGVGSLSASAQIEVVPATDQGGRLIIEGSSTMPANSVGVPIFLGSPYINELTVRYTGPDGNAGNVLDGQVAVAIAPVSNGAFSTLDDPETDENEFEILVGSGPVNMTAGVTTLFIHSFDRPGSVTVSVTAQDAVTEERFSEEFVIDIEDGAADFLPAELSLNASPGPIYITGTDAESTKQFTLNILDSGGNPVPNPQAEGVSFNNVRLQLAAPAGSGARLTGTGAGGPSSGTDISVRSVNGIVQFSLSAGSEVGPHQVTALVDRADNNVDNDIQDSLSTQTTVNVGDGQLFALRLVSPILNAIRVNPTTTLIETSFEPTIDPITGAFIPPNPDGTYSLTVTAVATDRAGNPPLPGQLVQFGKIDAPVSSTIPRFFVFSGSQGDPEEGGTLFSVVNPGENFGDDPTRPDEAVEPGDSLALFGKLVPGNREHEAARIVSSVVDNRTVTVNAPFNRNDGIGRIVDDGPVIPWVIGRSLVGTVDSSFELDARGRGSIRLTYPINALGDPVVLWAQGERVESTATKTVADVNAVAFPGVAPLLLSATPSVVPGNATVPVRLCVTDGLRAPINGSFVRGAITEGTATGTLDGNPMPTLTEEATGTNGSGCLITELTTTGLLPDGDSATVTFSIGGAQAEVEVAPPGSALLIVTPSQVTDNVSGGFTRQLELRLLNAGGEPIAGVGLVGSCDGGDGTLEISQAPGVTGSDGRTTASVFISMAACGETIADDSFPRVGQCEFTTDTGTPIGLFTAVGIDLRTTQPQVSPLPPNPVCPPLPEPVQPTQLAVDVVDNRTDPTPPALVTSDPEGISCDAAATGDCIATFTETTVVLEAPAGTAPVWSGDCAGITGSTRFAEVDLSTIDTTAVCLVTFND
ncbi:MAG: hypothetical protein V2J42_04745 [Wenzhouxiangella sp.]|jgi:hypothetical protein|nr:hypothetical protein [Wenzhouxiangella sp.]